MRNITKINYALCSTLALICSTNAATLFIESGNGPQANRSLNGFTVGQKFTVGASDLSVTSLGFEDADQDGLTDSHKVTIWRVSDGASIASTTVSSGTGATLIETWRYEDLAVAVTLLAGVDYYIAGLTTSADNITDVFHASSSGDGSIDFAISSDVTSTDFGAAPDDSSNVFRNGDGIPTNEGNDADLKWAPANFQYTVVPEPSSTALLGLGGLALILRRRK